MANYRNVGNARKKAETLIAEIKRLSSDAVVHAEFDKYKPAKMNIAGLNKLIDKANAKLTELETVQLPQPVQKKGFWRRTSEGVVNNANTLFALIALATFNIVAFFRDDGFWGMIWDILITAIAVIALMVIINLVWKGIMKLREFYRTARSFTANVAQATSQDPQPPQVQSVANNGGFLARQAAKKAAVRSGS